MYSFPFVLIMLFWKATLAGPDDFNTDTSAISLVGKMILLIDKLSLRCYDISRSPNLQQCKVIAPGHCPD